MKILYKEWWELWKSRCEVFIGEEKRWNFTRREKWKRGRIRNDGQITLSKTEIDIRNNIEL